MEENEITDEYDREFISLMLTIERCKQILSNHKNLSNEEIKQLRNYLYLMATLQMESEKKNNGTKEEEV